MLKTTQDKVYHFPSFMLLSEISEPLFSGSRLVVIYPKIILLLFFWHMSKASWDVHAPLESWDTVCD